MSQGEHLGDVPIGLGGRAVEPVALQGPRLILEDRSATLGEVRPVAVAEHPPEALGQVALIVVERAARPEIVLMLRIGYVRRRQAPIVAVEIQAEGHRATGGPDLFARWHGDIDLGGTVQLTAALYE